MGLADRAYARAEDDRWSSGGGGRAGVGRVRRWSCNTWLIAVNAAVFVLGAFAPAIGSVMQGVGHFSTYDAIFRLEIWRFITFQFLHAGVMHVFFNMFGLFLFGQMVENRLGGKRYLAFYLLCGICGAAMYLLLNLLGSAGVQIPGVLSSDPRTPLVGASAGVFGVLMAAAYYHPNAPMQLLLLPFTFRLQTLVYFYVAMALFNLFTSGKNAGGDAAHIGGALAGYFFIRRPHLLHDFFDVFGRSPPDSPAKSTRWPHRGNGRGASPAPDDGEVDRILAKVATQGLQSLSNREKDVLRKATEARQGSAR